MSQAACDEHLRSVGNNALGKAAEGIQQTRTPPRVHPVVLRYVAGQRSYGENGYRVVCCAEVGQRDQCGNATFGSPHAVNSLGEAFEDERDAALHADYLHQSSCHQGDDD